MAVGDGGEGGGTSPRLLHLTPLGRQNPGIHLRPQQLKTDCVSVCLCECMREKCFRWMAVCQKGGRDDD